MSGMSRISATFSIAGFVTQPPFCTCARRSNAITAEACRPAGYLAICFSTHFWFSGVNAKLSG